MKHFSKLLLLSATLLSGAVFAAPSTSTTGGVAVAAQSAPAAATPGAPVGAPEKLQTPKELEIVPVKKFNSDEAAAVVEVIKNYLRTNPAEFMQLVQMSMQFQEAKQEEKTLALLESNRDALMSTDNAIVLGNSKGTVTMVLVADPLCPNCRFLETMLKKLMAQQPALKVIVHQWAFVSPESARIAKFLHAAWQEDNAKFPKFLEGFLKLENIPSEDEMKALLTGAKYDFEKVKTAAMSPETAAVLEKIESLAKTLELRGAPMLLINGPDGRFLPVPPIAEQEMGKLVTELAKEAKAVSKEVKAEKTEKTEQPKAA